MRVKICESDVEFEAVADLLVNHLYHGRKKKACFNDLKEMRKQGWKLVAIFDESKKASVAASFYIGKRLYCGKYIQIENLAVVDNLRSEGLGKEVLNFVEEEGKKNHCDRIILDSYVENYDAHKFFFREEHYIRGYHFNKPLNGKPLGNKE